MSARDTHVIDHLVEPGKGRPFTVFTPEGVPLEFRIAPAGYRLVAFMIDAGTLFFAHLLLWLAARLSAGLEGISIMLIGSFLLRNFYFMWFEQLWQGRTPGKRARGLRVIDAGGGELTTESIIVRNLTREIEIFAPLVLLLAPYALWPGAPGWATLAALIWILVLAFLPLFNRQRRRLGDLAAGTVVVLSPKTILRPDLADTGAAREPAIEEEGAPGMARDGRTGQRTFTEHHLSHYGIYELQVLEKVLRDPPDWSSKRTLREISTKVQEKIGWEPSEPNPQAFLEDFYAAQRAYLERKMLLGKRREDKFDTAE
jgi:uncharacterized RDD family membrane protein YckC